MAPTQSSRTSISAAMLTPSVKMGKANRTQPPPRRASRPSCRRRPSGSPRPSTRRAHERRRSAPDRSRRSLAEAFRLTVSDGRAHVGASPSRREALPWQEWQGSAFALVRLRSLASTETAAIGRFERTGANGRERPPAFAMQKVEGSSPFIRLPSMPFPGCMGRGRAPFMPQTIGGRSGSDCVHR